MSCYKIRIPYTPKAKASVRTGRYGHYNPSCKGMLKTREFVRKYLKEHITSKTLLNGPLLVIVHYRIPSPRSLSGRKRQLQNFLPHIKRPDGDNLEKYLNDALNGIVWDDDSRIAWLVRSKSLCYETEGETVIFVRELNNETPNYDLIMSDIIEHIKIG